jgi:hypothetical protein
MNMDRICRYHPGRHAVVECQKMEFWYCLPGVSGGMPSLHRPLPLLQVSPGVRHLGTLPQGGPETVQGEGSL